MKALTWHGKRDVRVENVPDPAIKEPNDAIIKVTSTAICGSDLHLYEVLGPFLGEGDILGHEPMGIVTEVGSDITNIRPGDRVVIPFNISCGHCLMCAHRLYAQCETTASREHGTGAALFGYTKLYGQVPGAQAEYLRVPQAQFGPIKVPEGPPDERYLYLSDVLPTAWQAVQYARIPDGGSVGVLGLGPIGQMAARMARHLGYRVIAVDTVPERLAMASRHGAEIVDISETLDVGDAIREVTGGRGPDSVIDAVGMEAHGSPAAKFAHTLTGLLPDRLAASLMTSAGVDRLAALTMSIDVVRRGGTVSIVGLYAGAADPLPMLRMFDKGINLSMGQAHVRRWTDALLPLVNDESDPLGLMDFTTHQMPLDQAPHGYEMFQKKQDGAIKIMLKP
ncbi:glutathione-dependent formaldehyde dehydrogenase [Acrocarpospora phusangensis]|uniref:Glutathione-dependent formaldehyde dehydrogenase n=1 Tax=Acrocarpospora phusangensis TaxID=1070424 RepID=A0A919UMU5_9ACTN|nr:zinc-dependent alcohol dehydrogenase [Acrocarpospora phusangensis]GIH23673.1 glutathione-dependent formaldehyde dehydrogenase [Acrocarpospora phusangensis]